MTTLPTSSALPGPLAMAGNGPARAAMRIEREKENMEEDLDRRGQACQSPMRDGQCQRIRRGSQWRQAWLAREKFRANFHHPPHRASMKALLAIYPPHHDRF